MVTALSVSGLGFGSTGPAGRWGMGRLPVPVLWARNDVGVTIDDGLRINRHYETRERRQPSYAKAGEVVGVSRLVGRRSPAPRPDGRAGASRGRRRGAEGN